MFETDHFGHNACCEQIILHRALLETRLSTAHGAERLLGQIPQIKRELEQLELMANVAVRLRESSSHLRRVGVGLSDIVTATPRRKGIKNPPPFPFDFQRYRYKLVDNG